MAESARRTTIENIHAGGDLSIVLEVIEQHASFSEHELAEELMERLMPLIRETRKKIATEVTRDISHAFEQIRDEIHIRRDDADRISDAFAKTLWTAVEDDRISEFELKPHLLNLVDFFVRNREFFAGSAYSGRQLTLRTLPRVLSDFKAHSQSREDLDRIRYLCGVAFFLSFQYAKALKELDPVARQSFDSPAILMLVAESALNIGQFSVALRHFQRAGNLNTDHHERADLRRALLLSNIGACHEELLESEAAVLSYREALAVIRRDAADTETNLVRALVMNNLGYSLMTISNETRYDSNLEAAEELFSQALELRDAEDDSSANLASVMFNMAEVKRKFGQLGEAAYWIDRAEGKMNSFERPHILHATIWNAKGRSQFDRREYREAIESFRRARTALEANFGEKSIKVVHTTYSIAQALEALSDPEAHSTLIYTRTLALSIIGDETHPFVRMIDDDIKNPQPLDF